LQTYEPVCIRKPVPPEVHKPFRQDNGFSSNRLCIAVTMPKVFPMTGNPRVTYAGRNKMKRKKVRIANQAIRTYVE
jgi:hypothetical protein